MQVVILSRGDFVDGAVEDEADRGGVSGQGGEECGVIAIACFGCC